MRILFSLTLLLLLSSCAMQSKLRVSSNPVGADVLLVSQDGSARSLGKTPLDIDTSAMNLSGGFLLEITHEGHEQKNIFLSSESRSENQSLNINLNKKLDDPKIIDSRERQEKLARSVAQASNLINTKRYDEARILLNSLITEYPQVSVAYDLSGGLSYLQRDLRSALRYYERSLAINPENNETREIINRIKSMLQ